MKKSISLILAAALGFGSFQSAFAKDVIGSGSHYVRVTNQDGMVMFEECFKGSKPECIRTLGPKTWYSLEELNSQRAIESWQGYGSIVADFGIVVAAIAGGAVIGGAIASSATAGSSVLGGVFASVGGGILGAGAGGVGGMAIIKTVQVLNPYEQFRQASAISSDVINDHPVENSNMSKYIERLTLVLEKL